MSRDESPQGGRTASHAGNGSPILRLESVSRSYGDETAVDGFALTVREGELLTLLGPSGCGKTTTLRLIAGLEAPDAGTITLGGREVASPAGVLPPEERNVGMVFQDYALFPHLTVEENVAFGLQERGVPARVDELLELGGLEGHREKTPSQLSGGQKQRVALARSLAPEPDVLLLDEPFSNLDVRLRVEMREEVRAILKEAGVTAISVTHDQEEALTISDRVAIIDSGTVAQVGPPEQVFQHPKSRFVARFLGRTSFLSGQVVEASVETELGSLDTDQLHGQNTPPDGTAVDVLVRPDDLSAVPPREGAATGHIVEREYDGPSVVYRVRLGNGTVVGCRHNHADAFDVGESVGVDVAADHPFAWFPAA